MTARLHATGALERAAPRAWLAVTAVLVGGSLLALLLPAPWLDWQPELAWKNPWRAMSAAWVHWSEQHLGANLLAAAVVGAYGFSGQVPRSQALAWVASWPLTHLALLVKPDLLHYGGLSGVLHAGVAIVCLHLLVHGHGRQRWVGAGVSLGLVVKLVSEKPWGAALQRSADWDIAVAPLAHTTGALAGLLCGGLALVWVQRQGAPASAAGAVQTAQAAAPRSAPDTGRRP